jgi:Haem-binding domain
MWPWHSHLAPASFLVVNHVNDGRRRLNFSEWDKPQRATLKGVEDNVTRGEMPIWSYLLVHRHAKLTSAEAKHLLDGLRATFLQDPPIARQR